MAEYNRDVITSNLPNSETFMDRQFNNTGIVNWLGIVVDNNDEFKDGRCKVRVFGKHDGLKDDELPWAYPFMSNVFGGGEGGNGSFIYPKKNHLVNIIFDQNDDYSLLYTNIVAMNSKMKSEFENSYVNCQVLTFDEDEDLKIIYTQEKGLLLWSKESFINIDKSQNIYVSHKGGPSKIQLIEGDITEFSNSSHYIDSPKVDVGHAASFKDTKCPPLFDLLGMLAKSIDAKLPATPGVNSGLVDTFKMSICSDIVKIA